MSLFGTPNVEKLKAKGDVIGLIKALGYTKNVGIRTDAAEALGEIGDTRGVEPLIDSLRDQEFVVREVAIQALGKIGDKRAVEPLIHALQDTFFGVRGLAARALGEIGDQRTVEPLIEALKSWTVWSGAKEAGVALWMIGDKRGVEVLRACLRDPKEDVRVSAADALLLTGELEPGGDVEGYFVVEPPEADGGCDDNECPCSGFLPIPRGEGYLYISMTVVNNRRHKRTELLVKNLAKRTISVSEGSFGATVLQQGVYYPILCCERGARRRKLDLQVAAQDAAFWWETGLVPLRPTPRAK